MINLDSLIEKTRQEIYNHNGDISRNDLYNNVGIVCAELNLSRSEYFERIADPIYEEYGINLQELVKQTQEYLVATNGEQPRHEIFNHFYNDCKKLNISEEFFYKRILKQASKNVEQESLSIEEKEQKHETKNKLNKQLNVDENKIKDNSAFFKRLIKIIFEDGIVESEELQKIFRKAEECNADVDKIVKDIDEQLDQANFRSFPQANLEADSLKEVLLSANWYSEPIYSVMINPLTDEPTNDVRGPSKKGKLPILQVIIFAFIILVGIISLLVYLFKNKEGSYSTWCGNYLDFYFYGLLFLVVLTFFYAHYEIRALRKTPFYLQIPFFLTLVVFFFVIPFLLERFGKEIDDYAQKKWKSDYHWFWPSSILLYPIENIRINESIDTVYTITNLQDVEQVDSKTLPKKEITITIVDNTLSAIPDEYIKRLTSDERNRIIQKLRKIDSLERKLYDFELRDLLAVYINTNFSDTRHFDITNETFLFNGMDTGRNFNLSTSSTVFDDYKVNYLKKYSIESNKSDSVQKTVRAGGDPGRTDFSLFCKYVLKSLEHRKESAPGLFKDCNISLNIISDFLHEIKSSKNDSVSNFYEVDNSISNLISFLGKDLKNVNLYKLPLSKADNASEVNKTLSLFNKNCEFNNANIFDIEFYLSSGISLTTPGLLNPYFDFLEDNSLTFIRKRLERRTKAVTKIIYQRQLAGEDTLTCCLKDNTMDQDRSHGNYKIYYSSSNISSDRMVNINTPFVIDKFSHGSFILLSMEKGHIPNDPADFSFEIYSTQLKKKVSLPVEFYSSTPSSINFSIFFFESLCYFTIILLLLLVIHRVHLNMLFYERYFVNFFAWFSASALIIPILVIWLYYDGFIEQFHIPQLLKNLVYGSVSVIYFLIIYAYRYHNSKFLFLEKYVKNHTDISPLFGRLFFAKKITLSTKSLKANPY